MITTRYTNLDEILEKVRNDYGFEDVFRTECKEWVWDVLGFIGAPEYLINKTTEIDIEDWRGELPVDVFSLRNHTLREKKSQTIMSITNSVYHREEGVDSRDAVITADKSINFDGGERVDGTQYLSIIAPLYDPKDLSYQIKGDYIFTAMKFMTVELNYTAFPMDTERLEPLIPNEPKAIRAVSNYIAERIAFRLMLKDKLSERKYEIIKQEYLFNVGAASTSARIQSVPEWENIKNRTLQLVKQTQSFSRGFK
jgi:hypothetical protein